ncbi:MAG: hypothetical protein HRF43_18650 [Phycisphaerae bacterium]
MSVLLLGSAVPGQATIITFDDLLGGGYVPGGYGDRVADSGGGTGYMQGNGWTPNISVSFDTLNLATHSLTFGGLRTWGGGYGDLYMAVWPTAESGHAGWFAFTPDPGYAVRINAFQLGGYPLRDYDGQPVQITDSSFVVLWTGDGHVEGEEGGSPSHSDYAPNLVSSGTVYLIYGNNWNIGIDWIDFDQIRLCGTLAPPDFNQDCAVDGLDVELFNVCASGPAVAVSAECATRDLDGDGDADQSDFALLQRCYTGPGRIASPDCAD